MKAIVCLLILAWCVLLAKTQPNPSEDFANHAILDPNSMVKLYWKFDDTHVTFEVHGHTTGWLGVGLSPSGSMANADICVGWVLSSGQGKITDRHGSSDNSFPPLDENHNLEALEAREEDGWTLLKFRRELASCDVPNDLEITSNTMKIIYAFGSDDPTGDDITFDHYHGPTSRGTKSLLLLQPEKTDETEFPPGETHQTFDLLNDKFSVPAEDTYYNCRLFKLPEFAEKQHIVKMEPVIQLGNEANVHHMLVYQCSQNVTNGSSIGANSQCHLGNMPTDFQSCEFVIQGWAIGGGALYFPKNVGFPLGSPGAPRYVTLETHYDNPLKRPDIVDSSGLRFTYTPDLREFDSGTLEVGHSVSGLEHVIPPGAGAFRSQAECSADCLEKTLDEEGIDEIKVFATVLHSHLMGRKMTLRHFRDGKEMPFVAHDDNYDFNFQETRYSEEEITVKKGDAFQVVCEYDSTGKTGITSGGLSTNDEMCLVYVFYYPKISLTFWETAPEFEALMKFFGVLAYTVTDFPTVYSDLSIVTINEPAEFQGLTVKELLNGMDWNSATLEEFETGLNNLTKWQRCFKIDGSKPQGLVRSQLPIYVENPYTKQPRQCLAAEETTPQPEMTTSSSNTVLFDINIIPIILFGLISQYI